MVFKPQTIRSLAITNHDVEMTTAEDAYEEY